MSMTLARRSVKMLCVVGGLLCLFSMVQSAVSQMPTATILGVAKDPSGAVIPGVNLTARSIETGLARTTTTAGDGRYRFAALPVGGYEVRAEHEGFQTEVRSGITLAVSEEAVVNFTLNVGAVEQTVAVTAEAPLVNTTTGSLGGLVGEQKVAELPLNGRNYIELSLMQLGVTQHKDMSNAASTVGLWFSSNGAPLRSNNYMLDGAIMTNNTGATSASSDGSTLGIEGVREYRVITNSFSAEYGMTMGSQVVLVSKSGSNQFHGNVFEYLRNNVFDARNFFDYPSAATSSHFRLPPYKRNQFGAAGGGPIKRDKTFFFTAYEGLRERLGVTQIANVMHAGCHGGAGAVVTNTACPELGAVSSVTIVPQVAPLLALFPNPNLPDSNNAARYTLPFSQPTREDFGQVRVDQSFSANDTLFGRYTVDDTTQNNPLNYPVYQQLRLSRSQFATLSENHIFSPALLNTFRLSFSRTNPRVLSNKDLIGPQYSYSPGTPMGSLGPGSGVTALGPASKSIQTRNIWSLSEDLFYNRGSHSLKFGSLVNQLKNFSSTNTQALGSLTFSNIAGFLQGQPNNYNGNTPGSILERTYLFYTIGLYIQDDFHVRSNLTLNVGLRYEFMTTTTETKGHGSALRDVQHDAAPTLGEPFRNMSLKNFSPRFGFAWDVKGDGKTAVRGGFALLYDIGVFGQALSIGGTGTPPFSTLSSARPSTFVLPLVYPPGSVGKTVRTVDYLMQQPHMLDYNIAIERQLPARIGLALAYAGSRGINIMKTTDGNPTVPQTLPDGRHFWPVNAPRTNPNWDGMEFKTAGSDSWYNSLQFGLTKAVGHGLQFQSSYSWAKVIDTTQGQAGADNAASNIFGSDPSRTQTDRAVADFDITHNWRFNTTYQLPGLVNGGKAIRALLNGWRMSSIVSMQTGYPFTPSLNSNRSRSVVNTGGGGIDRPDLLPGRNNGNIILGGPVRYFDPTAFALEPAGFLGNAGRNILRGPGLANFDFSLVKDTAIPMMGESGRLEFRAEFFNLLNHANFGMPNRTVFAGTQNTEAPLATAGVINSTSTAPRQVQFALKLLF